MKLLCWLLLLALARPPHQGELKSRAVLVYIAGVPSLRISLESRARQTIEVALPVGTPLRAVGGSGEPVYLGAPLELKLRPAERKQLVLPVISADKPGEGLYEPLADRTFAPQVSRVHRVLGAGEDQQMARFALLPPEQLSPEVHSRLSALQLPPLPFGTGLTQVELTGNSRYTLEGKRFTLVTPTIRCTTAAGSSSRPLRVCLWASTQGAYEGGHLNGFRLGEFELGSLAGGGVWPPFTLNLELRRPPAGRYSLVFTLEECGSNGYLITHWGNFSGWVDF